MKEVIGYDADGHTLYKDHGPSKVSRDRLTHHYVDARRHIFDKAIERTLDMPLRRRRGYIKAINGDFKHEITGKDRE